MTLKAWEEQLLVYLKEIPKEEKEKIIEYYREIYGDKVDAGYMGETILEEFGSPEDCARKILSENFNADLPPVKKEKTEKPVKKNKVAPSQIVGVVFFTLFIAIPLFASLLAIAASFAAVAVSGAASALAGVFGVVICPFIALVNGMPFAGILSYIGLGIAAFGVGTLLFVGFYYATKYTAIGSVRLFKILYLRRKNNEKNS